MLSNEFSIFCLVRNYNYVNNLMCKLQKHIYKLYTSYIINTTNKNLYTNELYELSTNINILYNTTIQKYKNDKSQEINKLIISYKDNFDILYDDIITKYYINENVPIDISYNIIHPIKSQIIDDVNSIAKKIGFSSISDYYKFIDSNEQIINCFEYFLPLNIDIVENKYNVSEDDIISITESNNIMTKRFFMKKCDNSPINIFISYFIIYIRHKKKNYIIKGIFENDILNFNTRVMAQISYPDLYKKLKYLMLQVKDNPFKIKFIKYCDIGDLIAVNYDNWLLMLNKFDKLYNKIKNKSFSSLMQYFTNKIDKPIDIYYIIKVLLLGTEEQINIAGMLFLVLKEKKTDNIMISDIIYSSLNFVSQIKLKNINIDIQEEMTKLSECQFDDVDLRKQLFLIRNIPSYVKKLVNEKINEMKLNNNDYYKQYTYAKSLIDFPWPNLNEKKFKVSSDNVLECTEYLEKIEMKLNNETYGHLKVKEKILLHISECISNPNADGYIMSFHGPPGVGKTMLAKSLAKSLDMPIIVIPLGGQNDGDILQGTGYTYTSSQPGNIIKELIRVGTTRCVLYLDELDKTSSRNEKSHNELTSIITQLTDPNMNSLFRDKFFQEISFPLNNMIIIASYNSNKSFDDALLNRFDEITIKPYNIREKIHIVEKFIIKELCSQMNFKNIIQINHETIKHVISTYTNECGVRELKRKFKIIIMKLNKLKLTNKLSEFIHDNIITLGIDDINYFLHDEIIYEQSNIVHDYDEIGVVNGMYAVAGKTGGIITFQAESNYQFKNNFDLKYTGSQSDIMKESVQCAYISAIRYIAVLLKFDNDKKLEKHILTNFPSGFHMHANNISTPKNGSSGGCAFAIALISLILQKPIKSNIAVTGELDIKNNIIPVGNISAKIAAAKNNNIKIVIIPKQNYNDVHKLEEEHPDLFDSSFKYKFASNLAEAVELIL